MNRFQDKVVYQIYPKSFNDSNGDGIGDLNGITQKLDYLKDLGVDYLWLTPIFVSPQNDNGYDVEDYYSINPDYGTMEDLERLIKEADERGIGIMFDMVFNHTSTNHKWFQKALAGDQEYQDFYIFKEGNPDTPPTNWESKFGGNAWKYVPELKKWYLHLFDETQADLNWNNPAVREELKKVVRFWKDKGIKGFRFDVVNLISKPEKFENDMVGDGRRFYTDGPHVHEYIHELARDTNLKDGITVGEMSSTDLENCIAYSKPENDELGMVFNFHHLKVDYKDGKKWELDTPDIKKLRNLYADWQKGMQDENGWMALFWCNHDQPRAVSRFGDDEKYWKESAKMIATATHLMRGTPYIYQGEEIGMTNAHFTHLDQYKDVESTNMAKILRDQGKGEEEILEILSERSRDNGRTPMQWNAEINAGFSEGKPWIEAADNFEQINVENQLEDPDSILSFYKKLIRLRKENPLISKGEIEFVYPDMDSVIAYKRKLGDQELLILNNFNEEEVLIELEEDYKDGKILLGSYSENPEHLLSSGSLRPFESVVIEKAQDKKDVE